MLSDNRDRTGDIEIKNKLTVTREGESDNGGKGKGCRGTCIKDPWTKLKRGKD